MFPLPTGGPLRSRPRCVAGSPLAVEAEQLGAQVHPARGGGGGSEAVDHGW